MGEVRSNDERCRVNLCGRKLIRSKQKRFGRVELTFADPVVKVPKFIIHDYPEGKSPNAEDYETEESKETLTNIVLGDLQGKQLPTGWSKCWRREGGKPYYFNAATGKSQGTKPKRFNVEMKEGVLEIKFTANITKYIESLKETNDTKKAKAQTAKDDDIKAKKIQTAKRNAELNDVPKTEYQWRQDAREPAVQPKAPPAEVKVEKRKTSDLEMLLNAAEAARYAKIADAALLGRSGSSGKVTQATHYQERMRRESKPLEASTPVGRGRKPKIRRVKKRRLIE